MTDADYVDNLELLANAPAISKSLTHNLEPAAGGIGLHMNAIKTGYTCFKLNVRLPLATYAN